MMIKPEFPFVLAPLAGVTDTAFRQICRTQGAALSYTEMVSAKGLYYRNPNTEELLRIRPEEGPVGIQLFGSEPAMLEFAARELADRPNVLIDINMGCPVPKVVKNGEGSALLNSPQLAAELVRAAAAAAAKPVTVKMRKGFAGAPGEMPAEDFALLMQDSGAAAITVHGRTREQYYSGKADWDVIKRVKKAVSIPVFGNGDVFSAEDAMRIMDFTGCDGVMIARGALGNPWIFRECIALYQGRPVPPRPEAEEIIQTVKKHLALCIKEKGESRAIKEMRKHVSWYTKGIKGAAVLRNSINSAVSAAALEEILDNLRSLL